MTQAQTQHWEQIVYVRELLICAHKQFIRADYSVFHVHDLYIPARRNYFERTRGDPPYWTRG